MKICVLIMAIWKRDSNRVNGNGCSGAERLQSIATVCVDLRWQRPWTMALSPFSIAHQIFVVHILVRTITPLHHRVCLTCNAEIYFPIHINPSQMFLQSSSVSSSGNFRSEANDENHLLSLKLCSTEDTIKRRRRRSFVCNFPTNFSNSY